MTDTEAVAKAIWHTRNGYYVDKKNEHEQWKAHKQAYLKDANVAIETLKSLKWTPPAKDEDENT